MLIWFNDSIVKSIMERFRIKEGYKINVAETLTVKTRR